jgi:hypothetical protein
LTSLGLSNPTAQDFQVGLDGLPLLGFTGSLPAIEKRLPPEVVGSFKLAS